MTLFDESGKAQQALPENAAQESGGNLDTLAGNVPTQRELLQAILIELRLHTHLLVEGLHLKHDDAQAMRRDPSLLKDI